MKERPILFKAPMVRAILDGSKTMTRRVVKQDRDGLLDCEPTPAWDAFWQCVACPYGKPGDRLWVASEIPGVGRAYCAGSDGVIYSRARGDWRPLKAHLNDNGYPCVTVLSDGRKTTRAVHSLVCAAFYGPPPFDGAQVRHLDGDPQRNTPDNLCWGTQAAELRPTTVPDAGLRIPRILLEIVSVRVEKLQDISEADAISEGVQHSTLNDPRVEYRWLWESISGPDSWAVNPWVWVIEFRRIEP